ncbi:MAG: SBBP repeat-containing protein [Myxococcales bacterium]|nr:SBBP repeat-containing protein [Myxococcales bacterium]
MGSSAARLALWLSLLTLACAASCNRSTDGSDGTLVLTLSSESLAVTVGESVDVVITLKANAALSAPVVMSVKGPADQALPTGIQATFDPMAATPAPDRPANSRLRLVVGPTAVDDEYTLVVRAKGQRPGEDASGTLRLTITGMATSWKRSIVTPGTEQIAALASDYSGGVYAALYTDGALAGGQNQGALDGYVLHYRNNGAVSFVQRFGTMSADIVAGLASDRAGNVYVAGYTYGSFPGQLPAGKADGFVAKLGSDGGLVWLTQLGTAEIDQLTSVVVDADGAVYAAGQTEGAFPGHTNAGLSDVVVVKLRPDGSQEWIRQFGTDQKDRTDGVPDDRSVALSLDAAGDVYVAGSTQGSFAGESSAGLGDAFVTRLDNTGKQIWLRQLGSVGNDAFLSLGPNPVGGVLAVGWARGPIAGQVQMGGQDALLVAFRPDGSRQFVRQIGTSYADSFESLYVTDSNIYAIGSTRGAFPGQSLAGVQDAFLMRLGLDGSTIWLRQLGTPLFDRGTAIAMSDGLLHIAGTTFGSFDPETMAMGSDGFLHQYPRE